MNAIHTTEYMNVLMVQNDMLDSAKLEEGIRRT